MKKLIPLMMCLVLSVMAFAQTGVDFQHLTFDEALAKALELQRQFKGK